MATQRDKQAGTASTAKRSRTQPTDRNHATSLQQPESTNEHLLSVRNLPRSMRSVDILALQRAVGNHAVDRYLSQTVQPAFVPPQQDHSGVSYNTGDDSALLQRLNLTPEELARLPHYNPRQLRDLLDQAEDDREEQDNQVRQTENLLVVQQIHAEIVRGIDVHAAADLARVIEQGRQIDVRLQAMQPQRARRDFLITSLTATIDRALQQELATAPIPSNLSEQAMQQQQIRDRRQALMNEEARRHPDLARELADLNNLIQPLDARMRELSDRRDQLQAQLQTQMQMVLQGMAWQGRNVPAEVHGRHVIDILRSMDHDSPQQVAQRLAALRQDLHATMTAGAAIVAARGRNPMLSLAQDVIHETQRMLHVGAGNQIRDLQRTQGLSQELTGLVRSIGRLYTRDPFLQIGQEALLASTLHAGNCGEHASVAFALLWRRLGGVQLTYYAHSIDHSFVVIGNPSDPDTAVVCDAWPRAAQAVLLRDFFVRTGIRNPRNIRCWGTANGADLMERARPTVDVDTAENRMEEERESMTEEEARRTWGAGNGIYDHQHTTF